MSDTDRPNLSANKAEWVDHVRRLDPNGNQGDPENMTKDELIALADQLEAQDPAGQTAPQDPGTAGTDQAGETRTATQTGSGDAADDTGTAARTAGSDYDTVTAGPGGQDQPARTSTQRSETTSAVTDRAPEEAGRLAQQQTPPASARVMGLPDSPSAAETGTGH